MPGLLFSPKQLHRPPTATAPESLPVRPDDAPGDPDLPDARIEPVTAANRCLDCGLPPSHCTCTQRPQVQSRCRFALLMHPDELDSPTNTGRFVAQCLADSPRFTWQRTEPDPALLEWLREDSGSTFVLFPADRESLQHRRTEPQTFIATPQPRLLLLDGTWKQARKILRKSPYLDELPLLSLDRIPPSRYGLRRGSDQGQLCTLETAAAVLRLLEEAPGADALDRYLALFCDHYRAFKSGHQP